jgi:hypothetical protein
MDRPYGISDFAFPSRWDREPASTRSFLAATQYSDKQAGEFEQLEKLNNFIPPQG